MIALGIDPGTSNPGLALIERKGSSWFILRLPVLGSLDALNAELSSIARSDALPSVVAFEDVAFSLHAKDPSIRRGQGSGRILEAVGAARLFASMIGIEPVGVSPITWRKLAAGSGRASKEQARAIAQRRVQGWPARQVSTNRSDAVCIALAGAIMTMAQSAAVITQGRNRV